MTTFLARTALQRCNAQAVGAALHSNFTWRTSQINSALQTTYTFSSQAIGTAAADRWVLVAVTQQVPTSVTVGGIAATSVIDDGGSISIWRANVPTGTTANIVVTMPAAATGCIMGYWTVDMATGVPADSALGSGFTSSAISGFDIPANGFAITVSQCGDSDVSHSIDQSFIEQAEVFDAPNSSNAAFSQRELVGAGVTGVTVTSTWTSSQFTFAAAASWA